jgi:hypothetical protein
MKQKACEIYETEFSYPLPTSLTFDDDQLLFVKAKSLVELILKGKFCSDNLIHLSGNLYI